MGVIVLADTPAPVDHVTHASGVLAAAAVNAYRLPDALDRCDVALRVLHAPDHVRAAVAALLDGDAVGGGA